MDYIIINGASTNIKQHGYTEDEILNDFRLRNLLNYVIEKAKKI